MDFEAATYVLVAIAFGAQDSLLSVIAFLAVMTVVLAVANIAVAIPTAFGGLGTFELVAAGTMTSMGIETAIAGAMVVTIHFILLTTAVIAGAVSLMADRRARHAFKVRFLGQVVPVNTGT
jgi:uncharacterized membrane protein YbhN (UPF0104 family)